jgi:hypothetical protein
MNGILREVDAERVSERINGGDRFLFVFLSGNLIFVPRRRRHLSQPFSVVRRQPLCWK